MAHKVQTVLLKEHCLVSLVASEYKIQLAATVAVVEGRQELEGLLEARELAVKDLQVVVRWLTFLVVRQAAVAAVLLLEQTAQVPLLALVVLVLVRQ
jgi:hypothetical protein